MNAHEVKMPDEQGNFINAAKGILPIDLLISKNDQ
jgi:hypothetical protein